jgi:tetratricopeptide (TPR) repeat protein
MEQDRSLEQQQFRARLEQTADLGMAQLARSLGDWDLALHEVNALPPSPALLAKLPAGTSLILVSRGAVMVYPERPLLFVPDPATAAPVQSSHVFDAADELELREQEYDRALAALDSLVNHPATRPEALLRIARINRKLEKPEDALEAYKRLASETGIGPAGVPYAVVAGNARCRILKELGRQEEASADAQALRNALLEGRWPLRRETFEYHWNELNRCGIGTAEPPQAAVDFSLLAAELFDRWESANRPGASSGGRDVRPDSSLRR